MRIKQQIVQIVSLFFSFSTLLCCALPALLGFIGFGAAFASILSVFPFLITLSKIKDWLFAFGFLFLFINAYFVFFKEKVVCQITISGTHQDHSACDIAGHWNKIFFWLSTAMLIFGFFMAYFALSLFKYLGIL